MTSRRQDMQSSTIDGIRYDGFYRGLVKKHCDAGKCKVFVPDVYPRRYAEP